VFVSCTVLNHALIKYVLYFIWISLMLPVEDRSNIGLHIVTMIKQEFIEDQ
jgi:hypothetical protein